MQKLIVLAVKNTLIIYVKKKKSWQIKKLKKNEYVMNVSPINCFW